VKQIGWGGRGRGEVGMEGRERREERDKREGWKGGKWGDWGERMGGGERREGRTLKGVVGGGIQGWRGWGRRGKSS